MWLVDQLAIVTQTPSGLPVLSSSLLDTLGNVSVSWEGSLELRRLSHWQLWTLSALSLWHYNLSLLLSSRRHVRSHWGSGLGQGPHCWNSHSSGATHHTPFEADSGEGRPFSGTLTTCYLIFLPTLWRSSPWEMKVGRGNPAQQAVLAVLFFSC